MAAVALRHVRIGALAVLLATAGMPVFAQQAPTGGVGLRATESQPLSRTDRGNAWKLIGAHQFSTNFGLEAAYGDLGRYGYASGITGLSAAGNVRMRAWSLAGTGQLALSRDWSLSGKVGMGSNLVDLSRVGGPLGPSPWLPNPAIGGADLLLGVGLGYHFGRGFGLRFEYENYGAAKLPGSNAPKSDSWAVNLRYSF